MQDILNFVTKLKSGDMQCIKQLLINGFDEQLLNDLANIPAAFLVEIESCFSLSIDGDKLTKQVKKITSKIEFEKRMYRAIPLGCSFKFAESNFGMNSNEFSSIRKSLSKEVPSSLTTPQYSIIYSEYQDVCDEFENDVDLYIELSERLSANHGLVVTIKTLCGICDEQNRY